MSAHSGVEIDDCPECAEVSGWQGKQGMRFAAQHIRHEATTEEALDLAALCEWVADTHRPDEHDVCRACGEQWFSDPDVGVVQCQAFLDARVLKNEWIIGKVKVIRDRWRGQ